MTVAAWYPDPLHPSKLRWWDGRAWTDFVSDAPPAVREQSARTTHSAGFVVRAAAVREAQNIRLAGDGTTDVRSPTSSERPAGTVGRPDARQGAQGTSTTETPGGSAPLTRRARRDALKEAPAPFVQTEAAARAETEALAVAQAEAIAAAEKQFLRSSSAAPRDWVPSLQEPERVLGGQPMASAHVPDHDDRREGLDWVSAPKARDATNGWVWLIALSPLWFPVAFAAPDWIDAAVGLGTMPPASRIGLALVTWTVLIAAIVFDASRLKRASFPATTSWVLGVLLLPIYMILRAVRVQAAVRRGTGVTWLYFALHIGVIACAVLTTTSFGPSVPVLDGPGMEQHITDTYLSDYGIEVTTSCPTDVSLDLGREFSCETMMPDGSVEIIDATVTDAEGSVTWTPRSQRPPDTTASRPLHTGIGV
jgi:hypothetical protein